MEHTPRPWMVDPDNPYEIESDTWGGIGQVWNEPAENEPLMEMARANARLIAAAPDLLAACELAYDYVAVEYNDGTPEDQRPIRGDYPALDELNDSLRAAIAKARGDDAT